MTSWSIMERRLMNRSQIKLLKSKWRNEKQSWVDDMK